MSFFFEFWGFFLGFEFLFLQITIFFRIFRSWIDLIQKWCSIQVFQLSSVRVSFSLIFFLSSDLFPQWPNYKPGVKVFRFTLIFYAKPPSVDCLFYFEVAFFMGYACANFPRWKHDDVVPFQIKISSSKFNTCKIHCL